MKPIIITVLMCWIGLSSCYVKQVPISDKHVYMQKHYDELKTNIPEAQVHIINDSIKVLFPNNLLFNKSSSELSPQVSPLMKRFANTLNKYKRTRILINGYTDSIGTKEINESISYERAETTKNKLEEFEVTSTRLYSWGFGERHPIACNRTEEGRKLNRRVEFVILYRDDSIGHHTEK